MGFVLSVLYFVTTYLGTDTVFGSLAAYHVEMITAAIVVFISLPSLPKSFLFKTPQTVALAGLTLGVFFSVLFTGWVGGAVQAFQSFIPNAFGYFLICLHCNSKRKLQIIVLLLIFVCFFVIAQASIELSTVAPQIAAGQAGAVAPYLLGQRNDAGQWFYRIRGQNLINDPNDFAQLIACTVPLTFIFWRRGKTLWNVLFVLLPVGGLLYGAYLTHSRGFLMALAAILIMAGRRRIGIIPSLLGAGALFVAASRFGFTGGREISAGSGAGRMELWAAAIGVLKSHPLFGVGFGNLPDYIGMTAHNSIMVCAGELGLFGFYFWSLFLLPTLRDVHALGWPKKKVDGPETTTSVEGEVNEFDELALPPAKAIFDDAELGRLGQLMILSFTGFLVTGFFLSRAFVLTLFVLGGIGEVGFQMALERGLVASRLKFARAMLYSGVLSVSLLLSVYILLQITFAR